ncbi:hypothetical protein DRJ17_05005 [Candidatus Woesearchaeota archaeon]|nr:MAG: hypothetical protein DRJ17_05005 [Candidatus Woesearchaeota archaeon]
MTYEIPKNLNRYSELFLWGMTFKQFGYALICIMAIAFIIMKAVIFPIWLRISVCFPIAGLGILLVFYKLDEKIKDRRNEQKSLHNTSFNDSKMDYFVNVKEITDNAIINKNGAMVAVLQVTPLDFSILSENKKEAILNAYQQWLKSLDYETQIVSRSVSLDISRWLNNLAEKPSVKQNMEHYRIFREWMLEQVSKSTVRNRLFYILLPYWMDLSTTNKTWKYWFNLLIGRVPDTREKSPAYLKAVKKLTERADNCMELLKRCGVEVKRLDNAELLELYASYFANVAKLNNTTVWPSLWLGKDREEKQNVVFKQTKDELASKGFML